MTFFFLIFDIAKKVITYISPWLWFSVWEFGWNLMKTWRSSVSKTVDSKILQSSPNNPKPNSVNQALNYPTYVHYGTQIPKFSSVSLYDQPFSRYFTFQDFPINSHVRISKCYKIFKTCRIAKRSNPPDNGLIKFGSHQMKTVGPVVIWNFKPHMVLC